MLHSRFELVTPSEAPLWDAFVAAHPQGSIFHTAAMAQVFAATKGHTPLAIAARDKKGQIAALLVAVRIDTLPGPARRFASRSVFFAEPICRNDEVGQAALTQLLEIHDTQMRGVLFAEVRPLCPAGPEQNVLKARCYEYKDYLNYELDLRPTEEELHARLDKSLRRHLRRNPEKGVAIEHCSSAENLGTIYSLFEQSYANARVPLADISLFRSAIELLPPGVLDTRLAYYEGHPVAAGVTLSYQNRMYAWYAGMTRVSGVSPYDSLVWDEILQAKRNGQTYYDFGGAGYPDEPYGVRDYKARFGGELVSYGRYRKVFGPLRMKMAEAVYSAARRVLAPKSPSANTK